MRILGFTDMEYFTILKNPCAAEHLFPDPYWISPDFRAIWTETKGVPPVSHCIIYRCCISSKNKCPVILSFTNWIIFQWVHCNPFRWRDTEEKGKGEDMYAPSCSHWPLFWPRSNEKNQKWVETSKTVRLNKQRLFINRLPDVL